jgi:hypothetical protein
MKDYFKIVFDWEEYIAEVGYNKFYISNYIAARIICEVNNNYFCYVYNDYKYSNYSNSSNSLSGSHFRKLDRAKEWCDLELKEMNVRTVGKEYRVFNIKI